MIDFNREAYAYWALRSRRSQAGYMSIALYSGPSIALADILTGSINDLASTGPYIGEIPKEHIHENLEDLGHTLLHVSRYTHNDDLLLLDTSKYSMTYKFARSNLTPTFIEAGTATHALIALHTDNYVQNGNCYYFLWGTVGAIGSGADIELSDVNITADTSIFHNDLKLQIT